MSAEKKKRKRFVCFNTVVRVSNTGDTPASNVLGTLHVTLILSITKGAVGNFLNASHCLYP